MTKFVSILRNGLWWLVHQDGDRVTFLYPQAVVGDCHRPGQRISEGRFNDYLESQA
jgi:hypothetical protein